MYTVVEVYLDIYMQSGRYISSGAFASNVKCVYASAPGHIIDCIKLTWGIYTDIVISYVHIQ